MAAACVYCGCFKDHHIGGVGKCKSSECECRHYVAIKEHPLQRYDHVAASTGTWMEKSKDGDWVDADEAFAEIDRLKARIDELEG